MRNFWKIIPSTLPQTTINRPASISGWAFRYSARKSTVSFLPTPNQGLVFKIGKATVPVSPKNIIFDKNHCSALQAGKAEIKETEHVLSAIYGLGITNLIIEITGPNEPPIMDGSSKPFVKTIRAAGIRKLAKNRKEIRITKSYRFSLSDSDGYIEVEPSNSNKLDLALEVVFPEPIGKQQLSLTVNPVTYQKEICFARPPLRCPVEEASAEKLRKWFKGYAKNRNSIIYYSKNNYLTKLRVNDEVVRHKILDFIGDIANTGLPITGKFRCYKINHKINGEFAKLITT